MRTLEFWILIVGVLGVPAVLLVFYLLAWIVGRAFYAGKLSAISSAFNFRRSKQCRKKKVDSSTAAPTPRT
jgi:hypothetical protein